MNGNNDWSSPSWWDVSPGQIFKIFIECQAFIASHSSPFTPCLALWSWYRYFPLYEVDIRTNYVRLDTEWDWIQCILLLWKVRWCGWWSLVFSCIFNNISVIKININSPSLHAYSQICIFQDLCESDMFMLINPSLVYSISWVKRLQQNIFSSRLSHVSSREMDGDLMQLENQVAVYGKDFLQKSCYSLFWSRDGPRWSHVIC